MNTEESIDRKFPFSVVLLKISAQCRGLGVFSESQQGMRKATGLLPGISLIRSTQRSYVLLAFSKPILKNGHGWSMVWHSIDRPSLSQVCSCGSFGLTEQVMMLTGALPSIGCRRRRIGRRKVSYLAGSRMSSMARMTTASTPSSPTHCGVISLGNLAWG